MIANDLWHLVISGFTDTTDPSQFDVLTNNQKNQLREMRRKDAKAMSMIEVALIEALFPIIAEANYSKEAWDIDTM